MSWISRFAIFICVFPGVGAANHDLRTSACVGSGPLQGNVAWPSRFRFVSVELPGHVAGLGRRLGAIVIDWVASALVAAVIFPGFKLGEPSADFPPLIVFFIEVTLFTWFFASSFGQKILGIDVVDISGRRLSLWRIALRTVLICLVLPAVIYDSQGRGLHDRAVGSVAILRTKRS